MNGKSNFVFFYFVLALYNIDPLVMLKRKEEEEEEGECFYYNI
jgi:hypothetical protein